MKRGAGDSMDGYDEVRGNMGKVHNSGNEDVDLDPLKTGVVTACVPVQYSPVILPVPRRESVEVVVFLAKLPLDCLRTTSISGKAKDVKVLNENGQLTCECL